ncbi:hypothetical protein LOTGIDRAFT_145524 [Lottia gigantea]|uniref:Uncharacterized protein n=1 Tax=Lottia gigantea TaxID=225164 RepID=V4ABN2_LOTGI|nr:hypothetical protein LOTGIDRAFT_145524 [Lottia gigantea]ESO92490.1 hypothetical protein LOTGIDRAFT_145524 [Lottia gigantea]
MLATVYFRPRCIYLSLCLSSVFTPSMLATVYFRSALYLLISLSIQCLHILYVGYCLFQAALYLPIYLSIQCLHTLYVGYCLFQVCAVFTYLSVYPVSSHPLCWLLSISGLRCIYLSDCPICAIFTCLSVCLVPLHPLCWLLSISGLCRIYLSISLFSAFTSSMLTTVYFRSVLYLPVYLSVQCFHTLYVGYYLFQVCGVFTCLSVCPVSSHLLCWLLSISGRCCIYLSICLSSIFTPSMLTTVYFRSVLYLPVYQSVQCGECFSRL